MPSLVPHAPSAAQLSQLKTLQAASATASATLASAQAALAAAQTAYLNAKAAEKQYEAYSYGNTMKNGVDEGNSLLV